MLYEVITHYKPASTRSEAVKILTKEMEAGRLEARLVEFFISYNFV